MVVLLIDNHQPGISRGVEKNQANEEPEAKDEEEKTPGLCSGCWVEGQGCRV
jgi:hypothetical protein